MTTVRRIGGVGWMARGWMVPLAAVWAQAADPQGPTAGLADLSLEELMAVKIASVSTPSRFTQKTAEAPASVSVVTSEEIKIFGYRTLADILRGVRGLSVTGDRTYTYLGVRGFSRPSDFNSRVLVLIDGHRVNDNIFGAAFIGREFLLDVDLIDRVEVVRGPSSSLYGSGAFFGVINVITKRARDLPAVGVSVEGGSWDSYKGRFTLAGAATNAGLEYVLSGSLYESAGDEALYFREFDDPATNDGVAEHLDYERARNIFARVAGGDFTLSAGHVAREKGIPTAPWETVFNDPRYQAVDQHTYVDLQWKRGFGDDVDATARVYFDDYRYTADYPDEPFLDREHLGLTRDDDLGRMVGGEAQWTRRLPGHTLTLGAEARRHLNQDQSYYVVAPYTPILDDHESGWDAGLYAQDEWTLREDLLLSVGLRGDYFDSFGGTVNPRMGLIHRPWEDGTLKLLYGTAYRAPNAFELYYEADGSVANPDLDPERIRTCELVLEQVFPVNLRANVSGYYYQLDDLITQTGGDTWMFRNVDRAHAVGGEVELDWSQPGGLRAQASYSHQRAVDDATDDPLPDAPEDMIKVHVLAPLYRDQLYTGVEARYTGSMATLPGRATARADDHWIVNWTLFSQRWARGIELSGSLYNVFDARYAYPGGTGHLQDVLWQDGRSFRLKLTWSF